MTLPTQEQCREVIEELTDEPNLSKWEQDFVDSNEDRTFFTPAQRETIYNLAKKYQLKSYQP